MRLSRAVAYGAEMIEYDVRFTARASLEVSVHPDGRVEVVAPEGRRSTPSMGASTPAPAGYGDSSASSRSSSRARRHDYT